MERWLTDIIYCTKKKDVSNVQVSQECKHRNKTYKDIPEDISKEWIINRYGHCYRETELLIKAA